MRAAPPTVDRANHPPRPPGTITFRRAAAAHRLDLAEDIQGQRIPCWTLFITGPRIREWGFRSEEHTSALQSLMRTSYAVFCLKKKTPNLMYPIRLKNQATSQQHLYHRKPISATS